MDAFLWVVFATIIIIVIIVVAGVIIRTAILVGGSRSFINLADELREDNAYLKAELAAIKENLISIDKMMKEIE